MKIEAVPICLLAFVCLASSCSQSGDQGDVLSSLKTHISDIYDRNESKKSSLNINVIAEKLRDRIKSAINNISEAKLKDVGDVLDREIKDIDDTFGLSEFLNNVAKAIDANNDFKNTGDNRLVYSF
ncbi:hypothetical protein RRG08_064316 [Elysia crispata]|uniref:Uncharacterized protein n=1 Tax=Elysia crispata TaxID=231223 RepID=A0AAE1B376_9GAST|nr:hypothetical protein RRG08_064316 [Elysia crispata]